MHGVIQLASFVEAGVKMHGSEATYVHLYFFNYSTTEEQKQAYGTASLQHALYLSKFFVRHDELHAFHMRMSRLLAHATMLVSYATHDLYVVTCIPMRVRLPVHTNLLASCVTQKLLVRVPLLCSEITRARKYGG